MSLILRGNERSTCTQRVLAVLAEKGVTDFKLISPDFATGEHKKPPYLNKQPFGQVPVLEHGNFIIFESRAIGKYIATAFAGQGTMLVPDPTDVKATALFDQFASMEFSDFDPYAFNLASQKIFRPMRGQKPIPEIIDWCLENLALKLDTYEKILGKQKYMGGDEFSLVDIYYLPYTQKIFETGDGKLINDRPNVKAWWERVSTRESWKSVMALVPK